MHKYPVFPTSMMESGHLKIGGNIHLVKKDEQTFYPDHETYGISNSQEQIHYVDGSYLLKDAKPLKLECSFNELLSKLSNIMPSIPEGKRNEVLQILVNQDLRDEEKQSRLTSLVAFPLDFEESETLEKKRVFSRQRIDPRMKMPSQRRLLKVLLPCVIQVSKSLANLL